MLMTAPLCNYIIHVMYIESLYISCSRVNSIHCFTRYDRVLESLDSSSTILTYTYTRPLITVSWKQADLSRAHVYHILDTLSSSCTHTYTAKKLRTCVHIFMLLMNSYVFECVCVCVCV